MKKSIAGIIALVLIILTTRCQEEREVLLNDDPRDMPQEVSFSEEERTTLNSMNLSDFTGTSTRINAHLFSRYALFTVFSHYKPAIIKNGISYAREGEFLLPIEYPVYGVRPVAAGSTLEVYEVALNKEERNVTAKFRINAIFPPVDSLSEEAPTRVTIEARDIYSWDEHYNLSLSSQYLDDAGSVAGILNFDVVKFNPKNLDLLAIIPLAECPPVEGLSFESCAIEFLSESIKLSVLESELYTTSTFVYFDANGNEVARNSLPRTLSIATDPNKL